VGLRRLVDEGPFRPDNVKASVVSTRNVISLGPRILILAGGGGHSGYAFSLAQRLEGRAEMKFYVPEGDTLSFRRLSGFGEVGFLPKARGADTPLWRFLPGLVNAFGQAMLKSKNGFEVVVSTGSNFCIPPALLMRMKGVKLINIESSVRFTTPSKTASILQPFSTCTALQWKEQKALLRRGTYFGPILPRAVMQPWRGGYILVTGGTFGHRQLFDLMSESGYSNVLLQTGRIDPSRYQVRHPEWRIITSSPRFHELLAGAEVVVTHFGYTALEAIVYRKPMVLVLNPEWRLTVGFEDARMLASKLNAQFIHDLTLENLVNAIERAKSQSLPSFPDGAERLADAMLSMR
jgi:UDP-N-acetylglucosamine--N-acetylmuramyl-(pentapeptide) pyrophosphoryl-undecaprenol N-acetylglucosamine transferase